MVKRLYTGCSSPSIYLDKWNGWSHVKVRGALMSSPRLMPPRKARDLVKTLLEKVVIPLSSYF